MLYKFIMLIFTKTVAFFASFERKNRIEIKLIKNDSVKKIDNDFYIKTAWDFWVLAGTSFTSIDGINTSILYLDGKTMTTLTVAIKKMKKDEYFEKYCVYNEELKLYFYCKKDLDDFDKMRLEMDSIFYHRYFNHNPKSGSKEQGINLFVEYLSIIDCFFLLKQIF